jgi:hypothetical protein
MNPPSGWLNRFSKGPAHAVVPHPCADSYGEYFWAQYWDPELDCVIPLSATDVANVTNRIQQFQNMCAGEANWLYSINIYEWTGNYNSGYEWQAFSVWWPSEYVGIHWPYLDDWAILAHEGYHGSNQDPDETNARSRAYDCTYYLY